MITSTVSTNLLEIGFKITCACVTGCTVGMIASEGLMWGGRLWIWIKGSKEKVPDVMGHIGTEAYQRQLSVGLSVAFVGVQILVLIRDEGIQKRVLLSPLKSLGMFSGFCLTVMVGSVAASQMTLKNYRAFLMSNLLFVVAVSAHSLYQKYRTRS